MLAPQTGSIRLSLQLHAALHGDVRFTISWSSAPDAASSLHICVNFVYKITQILLHSFSSEIMTFWDTVCD